MPRDNGKTTEHTRTNCILHFKKRLYERVDMAVDADQFITILDHLIANAPSQHCRYIGRLNLEGRKAWRIVVDQVAYVVIYDHQLDCPVTIFRPEGLLNLRNLGTIELGKFA